MANQDEYAIAAGYNVALLSLTKLRTLVATGDTRPFWMPHCRGLYDPGLEEVDGDGLTTFKGSAAAPWLWDAMTWNQYVYLNTTYCASSYSGKVTIYTRLGGDTTYYRMNAVMKLPKPSDTDGKFYAPKRVQVMMTRLRVAS